VSLRFTPGYQYVAANAACICAKQHGGKKQAIVSWHHFGFKCPGTITLTILAFRQCFDTHKANANSLATILHL
jgi:hypothetical protein